MTLSEAEIRQVQRHCIETFELWYDQTAAIGTRVEHVGDAAVFQWPDLPIPLFNRAVGLGDRKPPDEESIERIVAIYRALGLPAFIQLSPLADRERVGRQLEASRLRQKGSMATLVMKVRAGTPEPKRSNASISVESVDESNAADFCSILLSAFGITEAFLPFMRATMSLPAMQNFLARCDGEPAGVGQLVHVAHVGGFYSGGTLERFRGRGVQSAMIDHRVRLAAEQGMTLLYSGTEQPDSQSSRNLQKHGFFIAYELENWEVPVATDAAAT
jgi:hypothetical protein